MADIVDTLLESIQTVVDGSLQNLQFDKTVVCTITSNSNAAKGEYTVSDGSTSFLAYSDNTEYAVNTTVYVNIPNGDFAKQKLITGKYLGSSTDYYTYVAPWKRFVDITGDLVADSASGAPWSILANKSAGETSSDEDYEEVKIWTKKITDGKDYTCIGIKADFKAWLSSFGTEFGTYGIRIYVRTVNKNTSKKVTYKADLSTLDMIGNPYAFESFYTQQKVIDVSGMGQIDTITLALFQQNDFYDGSYSLIPHTDENGTTLSDNIFVDNVYLALGYSVDEFDGDMAMLYSLDSDTYSSEYGRDNEKNIKHMLVRWIHKDDKGNIYGYTDSSSLGEDARVHWYKYKLDQNVVDDIAGSFWEEISDYQDTFEQTIDCFDHIDEQDVQYKVIIETPVKEYLLRDLNSDSEIAKLYIQLNEKLAEYTQAQERYSYNDTEANLASMEAAQSEYEAAQENYDDATEQYTSDVTYIESPVLKFTNEQPVADLATLDLIQSLSLDVDADGYKGVYNLYDQTNQIQNSTEANTMRIITANYKSTLTGDTDLDAAESITWMIPLVNTMIYPPEDGKEYDSEVDNVTYTDDGQFLMIERDGAEHTGSIGTSFDNAAQQYFRIKNYFTESATNNTITCYVVKDKKTYEAAADLVFGPMGTNGTDFTFILKMKSDQTCVYKGDYDPVQINASLYDYNNNEVPHAQNASITYSWYAQDDTIKIAFCDENGLLYDSTGNIIEYDTPLTKTTQLMRQYTPQVTTDDQHMYCFIRRLTENEMRALQGVADSEPDFTEEQLVPFYYILTASTTIDATSETKGLGKTMLNAYLPIPYSASYDYTQIAGTTKIVYNSAGISPYYYKDGYKLYSYADPVDSKLVYWQEKNGAETFEELKYYPTVDKDGTIIPPSTYVQDLSTQVAAVCYKNENDAPGEIYWTQPILMIQNAYSSAMLNAWDGSLTIDEDKGTIMSTMMGAGYKDKQNRYNGVLIGDVKSTADTGAGTGVFGYNEGVQSFGLKIDGTAFFGKSGKGQIQLDGNSGTIQSMSYKSGRSGMKIDLDDGLIDMRGNEVENVLEQKSIEIIELTDFSQEINTICLMKDNGQIDLSDASNAELVTALNTLHEYSNRQVSTLTDEEKQIITNALNYVKSATDTVQLASSSLDDYIAQNLIDSQNTISTYTTKSKELATQIKELQDLTSPTSSDLEDLANLQLTKDEYDRQIASLQTAVTDINVYETLCADMVNYQNAKAAEELADQYKKDALAYDEQIAELKSSQSGLDTAKTKLTKEIKTLKTSLDNLTVSAEDETQEDYLAEQTILQNTIASREDELQDIEDLLTEIDKQINDTTGALVQAKATAIANQQAQETAKTAAMGKLLANTANNIAYTDVIDVVSVKEKLQAEYKQLHAGETITQDALEEYSNDTDRLNAAVQNEYYILLNSESKNTVIPTKLVNTTVTTPTYKTTRSQVRIATESPYFKVVDTTGNTLIQVADNNYFLQTSGYSDPTNNDGSGGNGVKIDLKNDKIVGYNFSLKSMLSEYSDEEKTKASSLYNGSYVYLGSGGTDSDPFMQVQFVKHQADADGNATETKLANLPLLKITRDKFVLHSQTWVNGKDGLEFDLANGSIKAFNNFNLKATINSDTDEYDGSYIQLSSSGDPFFRVHYKHTTSGTATADADLDLINITKKYFVLQSHNWVANESGLQLDLDKGSLKAYNNFNLLAKITDNGDQYKDSYIQLRSNGSPFLRIHYVDTKGTSAQQDGLDLLNITTNKFLMQSQDWEDGTSGTQINLAKGKLTSYAFTIKAYREITTDGVKSSDKSQYILFDSTAASKPLYITGKETVTAEDGTTSTETNEFYVDWNGKVHASYIEATNGGKIGPFVITDSSLYIDSNSLSAGTVYLGRDGIGVHSGTNGFSAASATGQVDISGNCYITGSCYIKNNLEVSGFSTFIGGTNVKVNSSTGSSGYIGGSGYTGSGLGGGWGFTSTGGHVGPWYINNVGIYAGGTEATDTSADGATCVLNPGGTIKLTSKGMTLRLADSMFYVTTSGTDVSSNTGSITNTLCFSDTGFSANAGTNGYIRVGAYNDPEGYDTSGVGIAVTSTVARMGGTYGSVSVWNGGATMCFSRDAGGGYIDIRSSGLDILAGSGGAGGKIHLESGSVFLGTTGSVKASLELDTTNIKLDGGGKGKESASSDQYIKLGSNKGTLHFYKGILMNDSSLISTTTTTDAFGDLAFLDEVVISSATFKLGTSSLGTGTTTINKDTATYTITLPDNTYYKSNGTTSTYYKNGGSSYYYYRTGRTNYFYTDGSSETAYSAASGKTVDYSYPEYSGTYVSTLGDSVTVGNYTELSTFTATITVKAQAKSTTSS